MKPEIKAMLPEMPYCTPSSIYAKSVKVITLVDFEAWVEKVIEGARVVYGKEYDDKSFGMSERCSSVDTHTPHSSSA